MSEITFVTALYYSNYYDVIGGRGYDTSYYFPNLKSLCKLDANLIIYTHQREKLKIVEAVVAETGLENVTTAHNRIENIKDRKFDFVVSRAVAPLKELWRWSKPLLKTKNAIVQEQSFAPGLICLKGGDLATEIHESLTKPRMIEIIELFREPYFKEKYLLYVRR